MELEFLDDAAPELASWIADRGNYLFEEQPRARHRAVLQLHAAEADGWSDPEETEE
jgi:hypothetical protein